MSKNMKKVVALDLDDTIASFREPMYQLLKKLTDKDVHWNDWDRYHVGEYFYDMSGVDFCNHIVEHEVLQNIEPHDESAEVLTELYDRGYHVAIVSARSFHPDAENITKAWFDKYNLPYGSVHISTHVAPKITVLEYDNIVVSVDDNIEHSQDYIDSNRVKNVLLYDMPWNKNSEIKRIKTLKEIYNYI